MLLRNPLLKLAVFLRKPKGITVSSILHNIHQLNVKLFDNLEKTKQRKFAALTKKTPLPNRSRITVFKIPDTLELSSEETKILEKGLSFIPTPTHIDETSTKSDLDNFFRRIRLHAHFNNPNEAFIEREEVNNFSKYQKKISNWIPDSSPSAVDTFINTCKGEINAIRCDISNIPSNLTKEEHQALSRLRNRKDVLIKPADKGGAVVVWDKDLHLYTCQKRSAN